MFEVLDTSEATQPETFVVGLRCLHEYRQRSRVARCGEQFEEPAAEPAIGLGAVFGDQLFDVLRGARTKPMKAVFLQLRIALPHHPHALFESGKSSALRHVDYRTVETTS
jgi:hypothetical protein